MSDAHETANHHSYFEQDFQMLLAFKEGKI